MVLTNDTALVKCASHRSREKLYRLIGKDNAKPHYSMHRDVGTGGVFLIPADRAAEAKAITGISGYRDGDDLAPCWPSQSIRDLVNR